MREIMTTFPHAREVGSNRLLCLLLCVQCWSRSKLIGLPVLTVPWRWTNSLLSVRESRSGEVSGVPETASVSPFPPPNAERRDCHPKNHQKREWKTKSQETAMAICKGPCVRHLQNQWVNPWSWVKTVSITLDDKMATVLKSIPRSDAKKNSRYDLIQDVVEMLTAAKDHRYFVSRIILLCGSRWFLWRSSKDANNSWFHPSFEIFRTVSKKHSSADNDSLIPHPRNPTFPLSFNVISPNWNPRTD